ncbi:hypothetical protein FA15DRAFT_759353 [Coprinopsis marcescibilis]|uniref:Uncharacterized protein n=1 Tax=Coprinopsis marcescibilis TaxID=230819 RepID=A0A5C3KKN1_COPMA|nr:hypothetical protein FA15DRAFT_759353 [Coprinopsis marcescibilis]
MAHSPSSSQSFSPQRFIDLLTKNKDLNPSQNKDLRSYATHAGGLDSGDLLLRLASHAQLFRIENLLLKVLAKDDGVGQVLNDLKAHFKTKLSLNNEQKAVIIAVAKDCLVSPTITCYNTLDTIVWKRLEANKKDYKLKEFFGSQTNEDTLKTYVRTTCRSVRDQLRKEVITALKNQTPVDSLVNSIAKKYRHNRVETVPDNFIARVVMIGTALDESEDEDNDVAEENEDGTSVPPSRKRTRQNESSRQQGATDTTSRRQNGFWCQFDLQLQALIEEHGTDLSSEGWSRYLQALLKEERTLRAPAISRIPTFPSNIPEFRGSFALDSVTNTSPDSDSPVGSLAQQHAPDNWPRMSSFPPRTPDSAESTSTPRRIDHLVHQPPQPDQRRFSTPSSHTPPGSSISNSNSYSSAAPAPSAFGHRSQYSFSAHHVSSQDGWSPTASIPKPIRSQTPHRSLSLAQQQHRCNFTQPFSYGDLSFRVGHQAHSRHVSQSSLSYATHRESSARLGGLEY